MYTDWPGSPFSFYSILVRLKAHLTEKPQPCRIGFYSILVRLKDVWLVSASLWHSQMFLFHTGSIKSQYSRNSTEPCLTTIAFLFHTGSIKSAFASVTSFPYQCFYSILVRGKSRRCCDNKNQGKPEFLFHTGSIKSILMSTEAAKTF